MDCDCVFASLDCDDFNPLSDHTDSDSDCDSVYSATDCDDTNPLASFTENDADCDGVVTSEDCDDTDVNTINDMDCDGVLASIDCNDASSSVNNTNEQDTDCDLVSTDLDCDDNDSDVTNTNENDVDCELVLSSLDCDDNDSDDSIYPNAEENYLDDVDQDCDGIIDVVLTEVAEGDIIFSEIMHAPSRTLRYQGYVEFYNTTSSAVNLKNFVMGGTDNIEGYTIPNDVIIRPNDYVYFIARTSGNRNGGLYDAENGFIYGSSAGQFQPKIWVDTVVPRDSSSNIVDAVSYHSSTFPVERGTSISLPPEVLDGDLNDLPNAWCLI